MSAKDAFFKKVIDNSNAEKAEAKAKQQELSDFVNDCSQLLSRIQFWFDETESNITVEKSQRDISDGNEMVRVQYLCLKNGKKALNIAPESRGIVSVTLGPDSPFDNDRKTLFSLLWKDPKNTACMWTISYKDENQKQIDTPFNEDSFFTMLEPLA